MTDLKLEPVLDKFKTNLINKINQQDIDPKKAANIYTDAIDVWKTSLQDLTHLLSTSKTE